ncbi:hypothetical protein MKW92_027783 [Papaver armeniacum]|nr:hypothetical protein MKW92_027783 [Papaver armeniacum]
MGLFQSNSSSHVVGLFLFGCLAFLIQMSCTEAALQCAPEERYVSRTFKGVWQLTQCDDSCPKEIQTQCQSQNNRAVSKLRCNWWDPRTGDTRDEFATCEGCCGASLPTPPPPVTKECQAGERNKTYTLPASRPWNCSLCEEKCKAECGSEVELREMCVLNYVGELGGNTYTCRCCCKTKPPSPPPPPPPPSSPSCPSCPPPENTCDIKDMYFWHHGLQSLCRSVQE